MFGSARAECHPPHPTIHRANSGWVARIAGPTPGVNPWGWPRSNPTDHANPCERGAAMSGVTIERRSGTEKIKEATLYLDREHLADIRAGDHTTLAPTSDLEIEVSPSDGVTPSFTPRRDDDGELRAVYVELGRYELRALLGASRAEFQDPLRGVAVTVKGPEAIDE